MRMGDDRDYHNSSCRNVAAALIVVAAAAVLGGVLWLLA